MLGFKSHQITLSSRFALLLFSGLAGMFVFADRAPKTGLQGNDFLDHIIQCMNVIRGVRILVIDEWWGHLASRPELAAFVNPNEAPEDAQVPPQLDALRTLVSDRGKLGEQAVETYQRHVQFLEEQFTRFRPSVQWSTTSGNVIAWPVRTTGDFLELLVERRPEALLVLAYYATFLHAYRRCWAIHDIGERLVEAIDGVLGSHWKGWMVWPKEVLADAKRVEMEEGVVVSPES